MTNKISTEIRFNTFSNKNYYIINIDGMPLEDIIISTRPEIIPGLVPTLLNWLSDENERELVWSRVLPTNSSTSNLPILMCGDDVDLYCTVIIVEVEETKDYVYWNKFGLEKGDIYDLEIIGNEVEWFNNIKTMKFKKDEYLKVLNEFKFYLDKTIVNPYQ